MKPNKLRQPSDRIPLLSTADGRAPNGQGVLAAAAEGPGVTTPLSANTAPAPETAGMSETDRRIAVLERDLDTARRERDALKKEHQAELAALRASLEIKAARLERDAAVMECETKTRILRQQMGLTTRLLRDLTHERNVFQHHLDNIFRSSSWRLTAPLRALKSKLGRLGPR
jgi:hypothetical protein